MHDASPGAPPFTPGVGSRLGPYELTALLGRGGMSEVYRARDSRLPRTVAVKILRADAPTSAESRARFQREAHAIASLKHPHICVVHDVGEQDSVQYIVMEELDGESLADRLARGPLPYQELMARAIEIAGALDHAHRAGLIHRDVKPANIMLTRAGAKLVDFGVAALARADSGLLATTTVLTSAGHVVGTVQYMAPEQLEGLEVGPTADIFAAGAVLYEMATGRKAFDGRSASAVIAAIMTATPESIRASDPRCPRDLDWAVRRCLARAPQDRWQTAADLAAVLTRIRERSDEPAAVPSAGRAIGRARLLWPLLSLLMAVLLATSWAIGRGPAPREYPVAPLRVTVPVPGEVLVGADGLPALALSPDGRRIAYAVTGSQAGLLVRRLDRLEATLLPGTEGAATPFFSPDGTTIGFFAGGKLKTVSLDGSPPVTLCDAPRGRGGSWLDANTIVFAPSTDTPLFRVPASGGTPTAVTSLQTNPHERSHRWPEMLPGGTAVVFTSGNPTDTTLSDPQLVVQSLTEPHDRRVLVTGGAHARYAQGQLVYYAGRSLVAAPFDLSSLTLTGVPVTISEDVAISRFVGAAQYALSRENSLVYVPLSGLPRSRTLVWVESGGAITPVTEVSRAFTSARLSPDGRRIAVHLDEEDSDVWVYDLDRETFTRLTFDPGFDGNPLWTPDGTRIVYASERGPGLQLYSKRWDDPREEAAIAAGTYARVPHAWSPDGRYLVFTENHPGTRRDIWRLLAGSGTAEQLLAGPFEENGPAVSADGRWLAYHSNESGRDEVYVRPFAGAGGRLQVSNAGGSTPRWAGAGELFYRQGRKVAAVTIEEGRSGPEAGPIRTVLEGDFLGPFDVTPDGRRFLMIRTAPAQPRNLVFVQGWTAAPER